MGNKQYHATFRDIGQSSIALDFYEKKIVDFGDLVECWGFIHVLESTHVEVVDHSRHLKFHKFKCGRSYVDESRLRPLDHYEHPEKISNACPGCDPSMEEIVKWNI